MQEEEEEGMKSRGGHETFVKRCRRREKIERSGGDKQQKLEVKEGGKLGSRTSTRNSKSTPGDARARCGT